MKLLILTQKVDINDDVLGFMHGWIAEFAKNCEKVIVICLKKGEYELPENVKVLSLGKETGESRIKYLINFYKYIWQERKNYDAVFVHMNYEYVNLGGIFWRLLGKKIGLWYAHGKVKFQLKIAEILADQVFTSTSSGFRLPSKKLYIVGQGIDVNKFKVESKKLLALKNLGEGGKVNENRFNIISIGRISPVKNYETLIRAAEILKKQGLNFSVEILGGPGTAKQEEYLADLKLMVKINGLENIVNFLGPVSNRNIADYLAKADLFINTSNTGSLDKAILEAMACGLPVISCNEAFLEIFKDYKDNLFFTAGDAGELVEKINSINNLDDTGRDGLGENLRNIIVADHSLPGLIKKILNLYK